MQARLILTPIPALLEMSKINQKNGAQKQTLQSHIQFGGECNTEIVRLCERFLKKPAPFFRDLSDLSAGFSDYERPGVQDWTEELENLIL